MSAGRFLKSRGAGLTVQTGPLPGVVTQEIDGGPNYYANNSFTYAATAASSANGNTAFPNIWQGCTGWDDPHFFPIGSWLDLIGTQAITSTFGPLGYGSADTWHDLGLNTLFAQNSSTDLSLCSANAIWLIQMTGDARQVDTFRFQTGTATSPPSETVGFITFDEPQSWYQFTAAIGGIAANTITASYDNVAQLLNVTNITGSRTDIISGTHITGDGIFPQTPPTNFNGQIGGFGSGQGGIGTYGMQNFVNTTFAMIAQVGMKGPFTINETAASGITGAVVGQDAQLWDNGSKVMNGPVATWDPVLRRMSVNVTNVTSDASPALQVSNDWRVTLSVPSFTNNMTQVALVGNPNSLTDHRFYWTNFTNSGLGEAPIYTPSRDMHDMLTHQIATPSGVGIWATRKLNVMGMDWYPMSAGARIDAGNTTSNIFGIYNPCTSFTSMTPGLPPYTTVPFVVNNWPQPYITGANVTVDGGGHDQLIGTLASITPSGSTATLTVNVTERYGPVCTDAVGNAISMTIGGSFPYTTVTFRISPARTVVVGTSCYLYAVTQEIVGSGYDYIPHRQTGTIASYNAGTGDITMTINSVVGTGTLGLWYLVYPFTISSGWTLFYSMPPSQMNRATHYGNQVDMFREYYPKNADGSCIAPCLTFIDGSDPQDIGASNRNSRATRPFELIAMVWSAIMHRARWMPYFGQAMGHDPTIDGGQFFGSWAKSTTRADGTYTISQYDATKTISRLIQTLAPVINSKFLVASPTQPVTVSSSFGAGPTLPYTPYTIFGISNSKFNNNLDPVFEVMAHWYGYSTETINGVTLTQDKMWIWCMYRGPGADLDIAANIGIAPGTGTNRVTRIYADGVLGVTVGSTTTVTVGDTGTPGTKWVVAGDIVHIVGTVGVTNLNGDFLVFDVPSSTSFRFQQRVGGAAVTTTGALTRNGTAIFEHDINVVANAFTDTFPRGTSVGIYRVN